MSYGRPPVLVTAGSGFAPNRRSRGPQAGRASFEAKTQSRFRRGNGDSHVLLAADATADGRADLLCFDLMKGDFQVESGRWP